MKIYIAGKIGAAGVAAMRGAFDYAAAMLGEFNWLTVNPCDIPGGDTWSKCMVADIHEMLDCDAVYALGNWKGSPGATIEIQLALRLGKPVIYAKDVTKATPDGGVDWRVSPIVCICPACQVKGVDAKECPYYCD